MDALPDHKSRVEAALAINLREIDGRLAQVSQQRAIETFKIQDALENFRTAAGRIESASVRLETEHEALGRRVHAMEGESNQAQHGEIQALGRRVSKIEGFDERVAVLHEEQGQLREELPLLRVEIDRSRDAILVAVAAAMEAQKAAHDSRLAQLEAWYTREQEWAAQPWYVRWWRRMKGQQP